MADQRRHHHARTTPHWAAKSLTWARRFEQRCEDHWAFVAYAVLSTATAAYVINLMSAAC